MLPMQTFSFPKNVEVVSQPVKEWKAESALDFSIPRILHIVLMWMCGVVSTSILYRQKHKYNHVTACLMLQARVY